MATLKQKRLLCKGGLIALSLAVAGCSGGGLGQLLPGESSKPDAETAKAAKPSEAEQERILNELQALRTEQQSRAGKLGDDISTPKAELARRQSAGEIDASKADLSPSEISAAQQKAQAAQEEPKAEAAQRPAPPAIGSEAVSTALVENEAVYRNVDTCLKRPSGDFRDAFDGRSDLTKVVDKKKNQLYQNSDKSLIILTTNGNCDISFNGKNIDNYTAGLIHILEAQGGVVEKKTIAGIIIISVAHPRGEFRLATGRKVIGQGGSTNLYTTIKAL